MQFDILCFTDIHGILALPEQKWRNGLGWGWGQRGVMGRYWKKREGKLARLYNK